MSIHWCFSPWPFLSTFTHWYRFDTLRWRRVVDQPKDYAGQIACRLANVHLLNSLCSTRCSPTFGRSATHGQLQHPSTVSSTVQWHRCSMLLNLSSSLMIWLRKSIEHDSGHCHGHVLRCLAMLAARSCKLHACWTSYGGSPMSKRQRILECKMNPTKQTFLTELNHCLLRCEKQETILNRPTLFLTS